MNSEKSPFEDIANRLSGLIPAELEHMRRDLDRNFRAVLQSEFQRLGLVSREEFEVQREVLRNARAQLDELQARISELEAQATNKRTPRKPAPKQKKDKKI